MTELPELLPEPEPVSVTLGRKSTVEAVPGQIRGILLDKAQKGSVTMELSVEPAVEAPVSQGQRLGTLTLSSGGQLLQEIPLVAAEAVERLSYWELMGNVWKKAAMGK